MKLFKRQRIHKQMKNSIRDNNKQLIFMMQQKCFLQLRQKINNLNLFYTLNIIEFSKNIQSQLINYISKIFKSSQKMKQIQNNWTFKIKYHIILIINKIIQLLKINKLIQKDYIISNFLDIIQKLFNNRHLYKIQRKFIIKMISLIPIKLIYNNKMNKKLNLIKIKMENSLKEYIQQQKQNLKQKIKSKQEEETYLKIYTFIYFLDAHMIDRQYLSEIYSIVVKYLNKSLRHLQISRCPKLLLGTLQSLKYIMKPIMNQKQLGKKHLSQTCQFFVTKIMQYSQITYLNILSVQLQNLPYISLNQKVLKYIIEEAIDHLDSMLNQKQKTKIKKNIKNMGQKCILVIRKQLIDIWAIVTYNKLKQCKQKQKIYQLIEIFNLQSHKNILLYSQQLLRFFNIYHDYNIQDFILQIHLKKLFEYIFSMYFQEKICFKTVINFIKIVYQIFQKISQKTVKQQIIKQISSIYLQFYTLCDDEKKYKQIHHIINQNFKNIYDSLNLQEKKFWFQNYIFQLNYILNYIFRKNGQINRYLLQFLQTFLKTPQISKVNQKYSINFLQIILIISITQFQNQRQTLNQIYLPLNSNWHKSQLFHNFLQIISKNQKQLLIKSLNNCYTQFIWNNIPTNYMICILKIIKQNVEMKLLKIVKKIKRNQNVNFNFIKGIFQVLYLHKQKSLQKQILFFISNQFEKYIHQIQSIKFTQFNLKILKQLFENDAIYLLQMACCSHQNTRSIALKWLKIYLNKFPQIAFSQKIYFILIQLITIFQEKIQDDYQSISSLLVGEFINQTIYLPYNKKDLKKILLIYIHIFLQTILKGFIIDNIFITNQISYLISHHIVLTNNYIYAFKIFKSFLHYLKIKEKEHTKKQIWLLNNSQYFKSINLNSFIQNHTIINIIELDIQQNFSDKSFELINQLNKLLKYEIQIASIDLFNELSFQHKQSKTKIDILLFQIRYILLQYYIIQIMTQEKNKLELIKNTFIQNIIKKINDKNKPIHFIKSYYQNEIFIRLQQLKKYMFREHIKVYIIGEIFLMIKQVSLPQIANYMLKNLYSYTTFNQKELRKPKIIYLLIDLISSIIEEINQIFYIELIKRNEINIFVERYSQFESKYVLDENYIVNEWQMHIMFLNEYFMELRKRYVLNTYDLLLNFQANYIHRFITQNIQMNQIYKLIVLNFKIKKQFMQYLPIKINTKISQNNLLAFKLFKLGNQKQYFSITLSFLDQLLYKILKYGIYHFFKKQPYQNHYLFSKDSKVSQMEINIHRLNILKQILQSKDFKNFQRQKYRKKQVTSLFYKYNLKKSTIMRQNNQFDGNIIQLLKENKEIQQNKISLLILRDILISLLLTQINQCKSISYSLLKKLQNKYQKKQTNLLSLNKLKKFVLYYKNKNIGMTFIIIDKLHAEIEGGNENKQKIINFIKENVENWETYIDYSFMQNLFIQKFVNKPQQYKKLIFWQTNAIPLLFQYFSQQYSNFQYLHFICLKRLLNINPNTILFYLPEIFQLISHQSNKIAQKILIQITQKSKMIAHQLIWMAKVYLKIQYNPKVKLKKQIIDNVNILKQNSGRLKIEILRKMNKKDRIFFKNVDQFFERITSISGILKPNMSIQEKVNRITSQLNRIQILPELYMPTNPMYKIVDIIRDSGTPMQSAAKCPIKISFKCELYQGPDKFNLSNSNYIYQSKNIKTIDCIFKVFDDIRQDRLALQIIQLVKTIFQLNNFDLKLFSYRTISNRTGQQGNIGGIIQCLKNTQSIDEIGKNNQYGLYQYFINNFGNQQSQQFMMARQNFIRSQAAYSIFCYLLQVKDRHNGNILIDNITGYLIHIDFGFIFDISPANNMKFQSAQFKLSQQMINIMGGSIISQPFKHYMNLVIKGFILIRKYYKHIIYLIKMMTKSGLGCFKKNSIENLRERFKIQLNQAQAAQYMKNIILDAADKWTTNWYDRIQYFQNKIYH